MVDGIIILQFLLQKTV